MFQFPWVFCLYVCLIVSVMTQSVEEKADAPSSECGADFLQWKQFAILVSTKNLFLSGRGIHFVGGHKHTDRVCEGKATQLCQSCDIFVEFWVSILPSSKIFCWTEGCTQPLPASKNCVYSFNEFMCLWCGLKVKLIPDGRAHYYTEREICKILWTIYYQNCWEWKQPGEVRWWHYSGDVTPGAICAVI